MTQTAMQELIQELKDSLEVSENPFISTTINLIINMAENKLQKEKQQIIDAAYSNMNAIEEDPMDEAENYFKETYGE